MAVFRSTHFNRARGSLAGLSFSGSTTGQIVGFSKKPGKRTSSNLQIVYRQAFVFASRSWERVAAVNKAKWDVYASAVPEFKTGRSAFFSSQMSQYYYEHYRNLTHTRISGAPFKPERPVWNNLELTPGMVGTGSIGYRVNNDIFLTNPDPSSRTFAFYTSISLVPGSNRSGLTSHLTPLQHQAQAAPYPAGRVMVVSGLAKNCWHILKVVVMIRYGVRIPARVVTLRAQS